MNFTWLNLNKETGQVVLQFSTFDSLCNGDHKFILEELKTDTEDRCKGNVFGHSYVAEKECKVKASDHSVRKSRIVQHKKNEASPTCSKVTELLCIVYG
jgi:hypothetical protein